MRELLEQCAGRHSNLCLRQVLMARMELKAGQILRLSIPQRRKRLYTFVETNGCFTDGVAVATGWEVRVGLNLPMIGESRRRRLEI